MGENPKGGGGQLMATWAFFCEFSVYDIGVRRCSYLGGTILLNNENVISLRNNAYMQNCNLCKVGGGGALPPLPPASYAYV